MIKGRNIVCFSNDWNQDPLSKHHIMSRLSKNNRILWVNSIGLRTPTATIKDASRLIAKLKSFFRGAEKINDNFHVISPLVIPFHGVPLVKHINRLLLRLQVRGFLRRFTMERPIFWTFLPNTAGMVGFFRERLSLYYITDDFTKFKGHPSAAIERMENELIDKCDCVIASAGGLARKKQRGGKTIHVVRHGVDHAHFAKALSMESTMVPPDIRNIPRPILGFYGEINSWIDLPMIAEAAEKRPAWSFVLIGRIAVEAGDIGFLDKIPNIHLLGQKEYGTLPAYCAAFDAALIPKKINDLTICMNPLKLREYLAAGVPVISAPLPEVKPYADVVKFAVTADELIAAFEEISRTPEKEIARALSKRVESEGWDARVEEISAIIEKELRVKES